MSNAVPAFPTPPVPAVGLDVDLIADHLKEGGEIEKRTRGLLLLGVLPVAAWLAFAPLSSAVVAPGFVKVDQNRQVIQHAEGGTVRAVFVRDGEQVRAGQPLLELSDVSLNANESRLSHRLLTERAGVQRLQAEQQGAGRLTWSTDLLAAARKDPVLADHLSKEMSLFNSRWYSLQSQKDLLQVQRGKIAQELTLIRSQLERNQFSVGAQRRELDNQQTLVKEGFASPARVTQMEAAVADYDAKVEEKRADIVRAEQRLVDLQMKLSGLDNEHRQRASDELRSALVRVQELEQEVRKATDATRRQTIVAPADGEVMGLRITHAGTVIGPREPIAEVLPAAPKLVIEARIAPEDITRVQLGQAADLRFTAYSQRTTDDVVGKVSYVSADRLLEPQTQQPYFAVQVEVEAQAVEKATGGEKLQAGMTAEVFVRGRERTPLQYLIDPITQVLRHGGRER